jgi:hypothetical protein
LLYLDYTLSDKSAINLSHLITENYRPATSQKTNLSHLITETRVHRRKPQICDKSTINLSHLITENYRTATRKSSSQQFNLCSYYFQFDLKMTIWLRSIKKNPTWRSSPEVVFMYHTLSQKTTELRHVAKEENAHSWHEIFLIRWNIFKDSWINEWNRWSFCDEVW